MLLRQELFGTLKSLCRDFEARHRRAGGFAGENLLGGGHSSQVYKGDLDGTPVAVKVPRRRDAVPIAALRAGADRLAGLHAKGVVPLLGVARDGCTIFDLMQVSAPGQA